MDRDERLILEAFNEYASALETPDFSGAVKKCAPRRRPLRYIAAIAAACALLIIGAAAALGGFEWLTGTVKPGFGDLVLPVERSAESDGIRMDVLAARCYGKIGVVYVALTDTEGRGRITGQSAADSFRINRRWMAGEEAELVYYDSETQTAVYEFLLSDFGGTDAQGGELGTITVELRNLPVSEVVELPDAVIELDPAEISAAASEVMGEDRFPESAEGHIADIPGMEGWWISSAGVEDGRLCFNVRQPFSGSPYVYPRGGWAGEDYFINTETGRGEHVGFYLEAANGLRYNAANGNMLTLDGAGEPVSALDGYELRGACRSVYITVDMERLEGARLCCERSYMDVVPGPWVVETELDDSEGTKSLEAVLTDGEGRSFNAVIELSPLGVIVYDSGGLESYASLPTPYLVTADGMLSLCHSSGLSYYDDDGVMHQIEFHFASESIDLESVTAIVFDGQRIEIP